MKSEYVSRFRNDEGKGVLGCLLMIVVLGAALYLGIVLVPIYYAHMNFESDVEREASRAGANYLDNEQIIKEIIDMAKRHEIKIKRENVSVERFAGQLHLTVGYTVPVDFIITERDLNFDIKKSSMIGSL